MQITVIGGGYVGLVTAASLADIGHQTRLLEVAPERIAAIRSGIAPFHEPGLDDLLGEVYRREALIPGDRPSEALVGADLVLICVGTPLAPDGAADLTQVESACEAIAEHASRAPVVVRSTLPVGTTASLARWLRRSTSEHVVTNPEFLRQGSAISDFRHPTRILIGTHDGSEVAAATSVRNMYAEIDAPVLVTDYATAEMIKNASNAFLATKLSFVNEIADLCEAYGADIEAVVAGIGLDPRIGNAYLRAGIGFGGSCLPKELANLVRLGQRQGLAMPLLEGAGRANDSRSSTIVDRLERECGSLHGQRVGVLGLAFKPDTDDLRYSPALAIVERLLERGAEVVAHDPAVPPAATATIDGLIRVAAPEEVISGADLVVLATEWDAYRGLSWERLTTTARRAVLFDGRNALDHDLLRGAGWRVLAVGKAAQD